MATKKARQQKVMRASKAMRERSGSITDDRPLVALLYTLMRDGDVSPGAIESLMLDIEKAQPCEYSNGWLAAYAQDLADRLAP